MEISAIIIKDSKNEWGNRITTFLLTFPRIILAEKNTHRALSRNSASSRAIPFRTVAKNVQETPFIPIKWMKEHTGMQGTEYFIDEYIDGNNQVLNLQDEWLRAKESAIKHATNLSNMGLSKQICNRLLEPFMWHTALATTTDWSNFFALRAHEAAEIHIQDLAYKMLDEYNKSIPQLLKAGQWHIPFSEQIDETRLRDWGIQNYPEMMNYQKLQEFKAKVSAGICAGISYGRIKDKIDPLDMIDLYQSLVKRPYEGKRGTRSAIDPIHASPTEHQAQAMDVFQHELNPQSGNFKGFIQFRKMLPNENATDPRVIIK